MADYTTTGLFASVRRRASIPTTATIGGADADLLVYANEELRLGLVAEVLGLREGYFKRDSDTAISGVTYRIPTRAIGGKLAGVYMLDSSSNVIGDPLPEISDERQGSYDSTSGLIGYLIKGNNLILVPSASTSAAYVRMTYYEQPNELVTTGYTTITAINTSTSVVTVASTTGFTTSTPCDLVCATEGFQSLAISQTPISVDGSDLIAFSTLPSGLAVGDYVCLARKSPVPQIPSEFHPILAQRIACAWLESAGYVEQLKVAVEKLGAMESAISVLSSPRVDTGAKKILNRHSPLGLLAGRGRWGV